MKPTVANNFNALVLIGAGLYGYFILPQSVAERSVTALIPAFFGLLLLLLGLLWKSSPKIIAHIAAVLVLILAVMCINRFIKVEDLGAKK